MENEGTIFNSPHKKVDKFNALLNRNNTISIEQNMNARKLLKGSKIDNAEPIRIKRANVILKTPEAQLITATNLYTPHKTEEGPENENNSKSFDAALLSPTQGAPWKKIIKNFKRKSLQRK